MITLVSHTLQYSLSPTHTEFMKIITLTINPALDKSTSAAAIVPEKKLRCEPLALDAGGGGINVSKGLWRLGAKSLAVFPIGGNNGRVLHQLVKAEGVRTKVLQIAAETRESLSVSDQHTGLQYRFTMPGAAMSAEDATQLLDIVRDAKPNIIVASGSLPAGVETDYYARVAAMAQKIGARLIVDTNGQPLIEAAKQGVYLLKPNLGELSALMGVPELAMQDVDDAARQLIAQGRVEVVVVSLGGQGAVLVTKDRLEHIPVPPMKPKTTVGAGDSMVAGMTWALAQRQTESQMVRMGVACGSAATLHAGTQLFQAEDARKMLQWIDANGERYRFTAF
jgi:6-phosphofructokinase 2